MRLFFVMLGIMALFESTLAACIDVLKRTTVGVYANAWDERGSGSGCSPDGCTPDLTRDKDLDDESRWSCSKELEDETCEICFTFDEPQDINEVGIAFYRGDERTYKFKLTARGHSDGSKKQYQFTSSGETSFYEYFYLGTDETDRLCIKPVGLNDDEWFSMLEVVVCVD